VGSYTVVCFIERRRMGEGKGDIPLAEVSLQAKGPSNGIKGFPTHIILS